MADNWEIWMATVQMLGKAVSQTAFGLTYIGEHQMHEINS